MSIRTRAGHPAPTASAGQLPADLAQGMSPAPQILTRSKDLYLIHEDLARAHMRDRLQEAERRRRAKQVVRRKTHRAERVSIRGRLSGARRATGSHRPARRAA